MSQETELIKERLDLASLVSEYVTLKQAGQNLKGLCPFHSEKSPSFIVSPARGTWHCFGCNEGGDAFSFIEKIEGLDFPATLKMLAERTGVDLPKKMSGESSNRRQRLFDLLGEAAAFYHAILWQHKAGAKARGYLAKRGVTEETMREFSIGYAPMQWGVLQERLSKKGFQIEEMMAAGLISRNERGKTYDRFRGRIMFPVQDTQGRVVAFGGRIVPWHETGNEGKYVNSPETELYEKRRVVYNLNRAKQSLRAKEPCVVVEGYMDTVMLVQAGLPNVVASSGTAFTPEHIGQLSRFTKTLHFAFDRDSAGWKATVAATNAALAAGMTVKTVVLPEGVKDPADLALEQPEKVKEYFANTQSLITVLLEQFRTTSGLAGKEDQLAALLPLMQTVKNPIAQGEMIQEIAGSLHVPEQKIHQLLAVQPGLSFTSTLPISAETRPASQGVAGERQLLGLLIDQPVVREELFPQLSEELFVDRACKTVYTSMQHLAHTNPDFFSMPSSDLVQALPPQEVSLAQGLVALAQEMLSVTSESALHEGSMMLKALRKRLIASRLNVLQDQMAAGDEEGRNEALRQFQALTQELSAISNQ